MCLYRYLKARRYNVQKAEQMIRETLRWRGEVEPHKITASDVLPELKNTGKFYRNGFDRYGRPVLYMKPGKDNTSEPKTKLKHVLYNLEKCIKVMDEKKKELIN